MTRSDRVIYEGAIYHVYQRGNNKENIFDDPKSRSFVIKQFKEYNKKLDYQVLAFVIMYNHYHVLIKTGKDSISDIMFFINNLLGKFLNKKLERTGHVFEGRYKCKLVEDDAYLIWLIRYIHRNPIKAGICNTINDYSWSSHFFYKKGIDTFVNTSFILNILSNNKNEALEKYEKLVNFLDEGDTDNKNDFESIKEMFFPDETISELLKIHTSSEKVQICKSLESLVSTLNIPVEVLDQIRSGSKKQSITQYKLEIIKAAIKERYSLKEISNFFNAAPSTISKLCSRNNIALY